MLYKTVTLVYALSPSYRLTVLECLSHRYATHDIYTWTGQTLIALNPFERLPHLYGTDVIVTHHRLYQDTNSKVAIHQIALIGCTMSVIQIIMCQN